MKAKRMIRRGAMTVGVAVLFGGPAVAADLETINWSAVPVNSISLFYPGQSSWEYVNSKDHGGLKGTEKGVACGTCHEGEEEKIGNKLVAGGDLEPTPVDGKNGYIKLAMQVAYDQQNAFFRFQWKTRNNYAGIAHPFLRFDGKEWKVYGHPKLDAVVRSGEQPGIYEDRLSLMIDDGKVPGFAEQGCWLTCHNGERDMPDLPTKSEVQATPFFQMIKKSDVRKYLPDTRTDGTSWDAGKSAEEIAKLKADGVLLDLMQWRGHRSNPVGMADDFFVLEYRNGDAGKNPFSSNVDSKTHQPKFMYDAAKFGSNSIREADIRKGPVALIREENAVPFDPKAGWKEGDLIPEYVVSREDAKGSAADNTQAKGTWENGMWTVVWARKMNLSNNDDKALKVGGVYNFGFAVHDDNITTRGHHVSFPLSIGFGAKADIEAIRVE